MGAGSCYGRRRRHREKGRREHCERIAGIWHEEISVWASKSARKAANGTCSLTTTATAKPGRYLPEQRSAPQRAISPFTSTELAHYLATMRAAYPQHYPYFLCLARTGMREGEALGLYWEDIQFGQDLDDPHRFLHVQRTYDPVHHTCNTPKNGKSRRVD